MTLSYYRLLSPTPASPDDPADVWVNAEPHSTLRALRNGDPFRGAPPSSLGAEGFYDRLDFPQLASNNYLVVLRREVLRVLFDPHSIQTGHAVPLRIANILDPIDVRAERLKTESDDSPAFAYGVAYIPIAFGGIDLERSEWKQDSWLPDFKRVVLRSTRPHRTINVGGGVYFSEELVEEMDKVASLSWRKIESIRFEPKNTRA